MVGNEAVEAEKKTRPIKVAVQPAIGIHHVKTCMGMLGGDLSTQKSGLVSILQYEESRSMVEK